MTSDTELGEMPNNGKLHNAGSEIYLSKVLRDTQ